VGKPILAAFLLTGATLKLMAAGSTEGSALCAVLLGELSSLEFGTVCSECSRSPLAL
jgi:hypothetical protein